MSLESIFDLLNYTRTSDAGEFSLCLSMVFVYEYVLLSCR